MKKLWLKTKIHRPSRKTLLVFFLGLFIGCEAEIEELDIVYPPAFTLDGESSGHDTTPNIRFSNLDGISHIQLFSDSSCSQEISRKITVSYENTFTTNTLSYGNYTIYAKAWAGDMSSLCSKHFIHYELILSPISNISLNKEATVLSGENLPIFKVAPTVSEGKVQLFSDDACSAPISDKMATTSNMEDITTYGLSSGIYKVHAKKWDSDGNESLCSTSSVSYTVPVLPAQMHIAFAPGSRSLSESPTPVIRISEVQSGDMVQLFRDSSCSNAISAPTQSTGSTVDVTTNALDIGIHPIYIKRWDSQRVSPCSSNSISYEVKLPKITSIALAQGTTSPSENPTPVFRISGVNSGDRVQLFRDSSCNSVISASTQSSGSTIDVTTNTLGIGVYAVHAKRRDSNGRESLCSSNSVLYEFKIFTITNIVLAPGTTSPSENSTPVFRISGVNSEFLNTGDMVQLFRDSSCSNAISAPTQSSGSTIDVTTNTLGIGVYAVHAKRRNSNGRESACSSNSVSYEFKLSTITNIALAPGTTSPSENPTPVIRISGVNSGDMVQLFRDSSCNNPISVPTQSSGGTVDVTTNVLNVASYVIHAKKIDNNGGGSICSTDTVSYQVLEGYLAHMRNKHVLTQIATGGYHTCALTSSGNVKCWGYGGNGELGNNGTESKSYPVSVVDGSGSTTALAGIVQISAGHSHTCALTSSGNVKCWGNGGQGRLGNDGTENKSYPASVVDGSGSTTALAGIVQISAGDSHTCALTSSEHVKCWGQGGGSQLGNNGYYNKSYPVFVVDGYGNTTTLAGIVQISAGGYHTCALTSSGNVKCWGNDSGRLGLGNWRSRRRFGTAPKSYPVSVVDGSGSDTVLAGIVQISAGYTHTCALTSSGNVKCWGDGGHGQLGNDGTVATSYPVSVVDGNGSTTVLAGIVQISAGGYRTCALTSSGNVKCWGYGSSGQLGNNGTENTSYPVSVEDGSGSATPLVGIVQISAGYTHTCALTSSGNVKCRGSGSTAAFNFGMRLVEYTCVNGSCTLKPSSLPALSLQTPSSSPGTDTTPTIRAYHVEAQDTVSLHSDNACVEDSLVSDTVEEDSTTIDLTVSEIENDGKNMFYLKRNETCCFNSIEYVLDTSTLEEN